MSRMATKTPPTRNKPASLPAWDIQRIRRDFPILDRPVHGKPLVYLDNAATTQKPQPVLDAMTRYYQRDNANIHRAVHTLSQTATGLYDQARQKIQRFIHAAEPAEVIFTRGTTESINLVASGAAIKWLTPGDEVLISQMEHHSNIVPWQIACQRTGAVLKAAAVTDRGELDIVAFDQLLSERTRIVSLVHLSNALGTLNPIEELIHKAHAVGAKVLIDGAQAIAHVPVDAQALDADFYAFSGHKIYGPTGIGILYGKRRWLEELPPYQGGGDMIESVTIEKTIYAPLPSKFEAGTPHIAGVVGLGEAIDYVQSLGLPAIAAHEQQLLERATQGLEQIPGVRLIGTAKPKGAVVSFVVDEPPIASLDVGHQLDLAGVAVRTGHHCCQPIMDRFSISSTARASFALYNTLEEADIFVAAVADLVERAKAKRPSTLKCASSARDSDNSILAYPGPAAESVAAAAMELETLFTFLEDWPSRYEAIIEMGERLAPMPEALKTPANFVKGCQSIVHIAARKQPHSADVIEFLADSDANIVRGLIAILQKIYCGQHAGEVLAFDAKAFLSRLGLDDHLSMTRRNGLQAMVTRVRRVASEIAKR